MTYATYDELNNKHPFNQVYQNRKNVKKNNLKGYSGRQRTDTKKEFTYTYPVNECGCIDSNFKKNESTKKKKILCLGDSFTQGVGASFENSYPRQLQNELEKCNYPARVYNCGIGGAYPQSQFIYFKDLIEKKNYKLI